MKQIYGIDLSQDKFDVNYLDSKGSVRRMVVKNNLKGITNFLEGLPSGAVLCAEHTGVYGELLMFVCCSMNILFAVASGYQIKHSLGLAKGKSDTIDAQRIREYGERYYDKLQLAKYPADDFKEIKELYTLRAQLVKEKKMLLTHEKGKSHVPFRSIRAYLIVQNIEQSLTKAIDDLDAEIFSLIEANDELKRSYRLVSSIKGIGPVTASCLIIKTGNFQRIATARKAASYAGISPFPNSSGKMVKKSHISHMGDKELKTLLFLCSLVAVKVNPEYGYYFKRKQQEGKPYFVVMNNVANKLLRTTYSIIQTGKEYDMGHVCADPRKHKKVA
jgi:transposase